MAPSLRRRFRALVGLALLGVLTIAPPAPAQTVEATRAEAARVRAELDQLATELSVAAERHNRARAEVSAVQASLATAREDHARAAARLEQARNRVVEAAVLAYIGAGGPDVLSRLVGASDTDEMLVREQYLRVTSVDQRAVVGAMRAATEDLELLQGRLGEQEAQARAAAEAAAAREAEARAAESAHRALLGRIEGDLAELVAAEQARAEAEAVRSQPAAARSTTPAPVPAVAAQTAPAAPSSDAPASDRGAIAVAEAKKQIGKPYQWGGSGPDSFDCSGLTAWAWKAAGVTLPHSAYLQYKQTARVSVEDIRPGDLLFFGPNVEGIHHNAIYVGDGQMIEASQTGVPVRYRGWRAKDLVGIGRPG